jgi:hypothetical protein
VVGFGLCFGVATIARPAAAGQFPGTSRLETVSRSRAEHPTLMHAFSEDGPPDPDADWLIRF